MSGRIKIRGGGDDDLNPITLEPFSRRYYELQEKVREYPASQPDVKRDLFKLLDETNIILLTGETGSGKTTQVPKLVWEYLDYVDTVICTQPRTLTASRVSERVADELDVEFGRHVGFRFRGSEEERGGGIFGPAILAYMTEGTFLNNTFKDPTSLSYYGAVIIDEAHDRSIDVDMLLFYIRETLNLTGLRTKFIIMSATLDKDIFMKYFKDQEIKHYHISGRTFPVESRFLTQSIYHDLIPKGNSGLMYAAVSDAVIAIVNDILSSSEKRDNGDILVFIPVIRVLNTLKGKLEKYLDEQNYRNYQVMTLSSATPEEERSKITEIVPATTKIVLSTNIAETGVTINGIYYVIDSGLTFEPSYNMVERKTTLSLKFISQAEAKQRRGRAGRMKPGMCFHLFTTDEYQKFESFRKPEIYRSNFDKYLLRLFFQFKNTLNGHQYVKEVLGMLLSPPDKKGIKTTMKYFRELKLIDDELEKDRITDLGECFSGIDLNIDWARVFLTGTAYEIEQEIWIDLISILTLGTNLSPWFTVKEIPAEFKNQYLNEYGDLIGLYHIYLDYQDKKLPRDYVDMLNTRLFDEIEKVSENLQGGAVAKSFYCTDAIPPERKIRKDIYLNVISAFRQAMPENVINISKLDLSRYRNNLIDLKKEKEVLALSKVTLGSFGQTSFEVYDNFLRLV